MAWMLQSSYSSNDFMFIKNYSVNLMHVITLLICVKVLMQYSCVFIYIYSVINSKPELKDLYNFITRDHAAHWRVIGTLLGVNEGSLDAIEKNFPSNVKLCCNDLLKEWLNTDINARWKNIIEAIDSPAVMTLRATQTAPEAGN